MDQAILPAKELETPMKDSSFTGRYILQTRVLKLALWRLMSGALFSIAVGALSAGMFLGPAVAQTGGATPGSDSRQNTDPDPIVLALSRGKELRTAGRFDEALVMLDRALTSAPRDLQLRFLRALVLVDLKRVDDAITAFDTLTQEFPELGEPYNNLAVLLAGKGELEKARAALERAITAQPNYALAHENLGDIYLRLAEQAYQTAVQKAPSSSAAKRKLGLSKEWVKATE